VCACDRVGVRVTCPPSRALPLCQRIQPSSRPAAAVCAEKSQPWPCVPSARSERRQRRGLALLVVRAVALSALGPRSAGSSARSGAARIAAARHGACMRSLLTPAPPQDADSQVGVEASPAATPPPAAQLSMKERLALQGMPALGGGFVLPATPGAAAALTKTRTPAAAEIARARLAVPADSPSSDGDTRAAASDAAATPEQPSAEAPRTPQPTPASNMSLSERCVQPPLDSMPRLTFTSYQRRLQCRGANVSVACAQDAATWHPGTRRWRGPPTADSRCTLRPATHSGQPLHAWQHGRTDAATAASSGAAAAQGAAAACASGGALGAAPGYGAAAACRVSSERCLFC